MSNVRVKVNEIEPGDVFSEQSHYVFLGKDKNQLNFKHLESGNSVVLGEKYVEGLLTSADQYHEEIEVGKEDKFWTQKQIDEAKKAGKDVSNIRVGDLRLKGIRTIWDEINSAEVFMVAFNKKDKELSLKALREKREAQLQEALEKIEKAQKAKKGIASAAKEAILFVQSNPVLPLEKGEERILRGYKVQFQSITGYYDVIDIDLEGKGGSAKRQVNVNEINWLVLKGIKYIVKD